MGSKIPKPAPQANNTSHALLLKSANSGNFSQFTGERGFAYMSRQKSHAPSSRHAEQREQTKLDERIKLKE